MRSCVIDRAHWSLVRWLIVETDLLNLLDLKLLRVPLLAFTLVAPTVAVLLGRKTAALLLLLTGIGGMLYLRLDHIVELEMSYRVSKPNWKSRSPRPTRPM